MAKSTVAYWNALKPENQQKWKLVNGLEGIAEESTLGFDEGTREYTRLTRFLAPTPRRSEVRPTPSGEDRI